MADPITSYETVLVDHIDAVATITMNRPERRNALNRALERDLASVPPGFTGAQARQHILEAYWPIVELLVTMEKPVIAAINGVAAGADCSVALACDLSVMAEDAALLQAFSNIGLVPDAGSSWFLARQVGYHVAYEIAVEGKSVKAMRCLALGLTNKVVPGDELMPVAQQWATHLAKRPTFALGLTKQVMHAAMTASLHETVVHEAMLQERCFASEDHAEGIRAFLEKRAPVFKGR